MPFAAASYLGWQPGHPALALLGFTILFGWFVSTAVLASRSAAIGSRSSGLLPLNRLLVHSTVVGMVALFFWLWAVEKACHGALDLGVISFAVALIAHVDAFKLTQPGWVPHRYRNQRTVSCLRFLCVGSSWGVALNYVYVLVSAPHLLPPTFITYLVVGACFWSCAACRAACVMREGLLNDSLSEVLFQAHSPRSERERLAVDEET
jgi:hypothetical protein